jgi:TetR/AcrR family transcriptional regulator, regulator of cefoperazone and chloramphenicol sensitivity
MKKNATGMQNRKMAKTATTKSKGPAGRSACQDRSERTRQRLIEVAVEVFAELGYEASSTRAIVEKAQANLVSIPYYFGSKLGLYHAAAEYIGSNCAARFRPTVLRAREALQIKGLTHQQTLNNFIDFIVEFAEVMLGADTPNSWGQFIYREQFDPSGAFEILHQNFLPLLETGFEYVARLTGRPADAPETRIQFMAILAMVKFTRVDRAAVLRNMGWKSFGKDEIRIVTEMLRRDLQAIFAEPQAVTS